MNAAPPDAAVPVLRTLAGDGFVLEPLAVAHAGAMFEVLADPAIYQYENAPPVSAAWLRERYRRLEARRSPDGRQLWLNWVIRVAPAELAGYVQATVHADGNAGIAYELASRYWGRGLGSGAVRAMIGELAGHYNVVRLRAVAKAANFRSLRLLERLGFEAADPEALAAHPVEPDEVMRVRGARTS